MKWFLFLILSVIISKAQSQTLDFEVRDINNKWINLSELSGEKYTVVDFWATWCKPCVSALPKLSALSQKYASTEVSFIGVNVDGPRNQAKVKPFSQSLEIAYPIVLDPDQKILNDMNASVLPTLIILNNKQKEVYRHEGFKPGDEKIIESKLNELLEK